MMVAKQFLNTATQIISIAVYLSVSKTYVSSCLLNKMSLNFVLFAINDGRVLVFTAGCT